MRFFRCCAVCGREGSPTTESPARTWAARLKICWSLRQVSFVTAAWIVMVQVAAASSSSAESRRDERAEKRTGQVQVGWVEDPASQVESKLGLATQPTDSAPQSQVAGSATDPPTTIPKQPTPAPPRDPAPLAPGRGNLMGGDSTAATAPVQPRDGSGTLRVIVGRGSVEQKPDAAPHPAAAGQADRAADVSEDEPLKPIPDPQGSGPVEVQTASFNGVIPGVTTLGEVRKRWGPALKVTQQDDLLVHLYSMESFDHIEVSFFKDTVTSVVIRLDRFFPAAAVAQHLKLSNIRPVLVSNTLGEVLGQAFPERGVMFAFVPSKEPGKPTTQVSQIILEPVSAEPFVLRAETYLDTQLELSAADLEQAVKLDPNNARAHWLQSRALAAMGDHTRALAASQKAVRLDPDDPQYRVTLAQILGQAGDFLQGIKEAEKALENSDKRPHIKARAQCLLGDLLGSGPNPDYKKGIDYHTQAIETAEPLIDDRHPAIRLAAKEVLIDAHLGAAHDIAWGNWNQKQTAVTKWLERAAALAEQLGEDDGRAAEYRFRVAVRAIAAYVGLEGELDPTQWTEQTIRLADEQIARAQESLRKQRIRADLGMALYDAVQVYQMRGEHDAALKYGQQAIQQLQQVAATTRDNAANDYLLGRLCFRLGAIEAVGKQDHQAGVVWFEKAIPAFDRSIPAVGPSELGRLGETLVSMGVSYWEVGQHQKATQLTQRGVELIEQAVKGGTLAESALEIPYSNLAAMHRSLGQHEQADKLLQKASRDKDTTLK